MEPAEHLEGLREAMLAFTRYADRAGLAAPVPTCPGWTVRDLVGHLGSVHRWAAANLRLERSDIDGFVREGLTQADPLEWLADGAIDLVRAWAAAPDDVEALVFLRDAPAPKQFWARRQCHETTMHAVDALAACLGRAPAASEVWFGADLAADGVDELLTGFLPRPKYRLHADPPTTVAVAPSDRARGWHLRLSDGPVVTERVHEPGGPLAVTGPVRELYLRLWNRGAPVTEVPNWSAAAVN